MISIKFDKEKHTVPEFHATGNSTREIKKEVSEAIFHTVKEMAITFDMEVDEVLEELEEDLEFKVEEYLKSTNRKKKRFNFEFKFLDFTRHECKRSER